MNRRHGSAHYNVLAAQSPKTPFFDHWLKGGLVATFTRAWFIDGGFVEVLRGLGLAQELDGKVLRLLDAEFDPNSSRQAGAVRGIETRHSLASPARDKVKRFIAENLHSLCDQNHEPRAHTWRSALRFCRVIRVRCAPLLAEGIVTQLDDELSPVRKAPSLFTINTFGFKLYGKSDYDPETDSFMTTHYFVALFCPLFPVARYRVISPDGSSYQFLGKGRFRPFEMIHLALFAGIVIYAIATAGLK